MVGTRCSSRGSPHDDQETTAATVTRTSAHLPAQFHEAVVLHITLILLSYVGEPIRPVCPNVIELEVVPLPITAKHGQLPPWVTVPQGLVAVEYKAGQLLIREDLGDVSARTTSVHGEATQRCP